MFDPPRAVRVYVCRDCRAPMLPHAAISLITLCSSFTSSAVCRYTPFVLLLPPLLRQAVLLPPPACRYVAALMLPIIFRYAAFPD